RRERGGSIQVDHPALLHHGHPSQRLVIAALLRDALEYLEEGQSGHDERAGRFDGLGELSRVRTVGEVLEPRRGVHHIHTRSGSRGTSVEIPFRDPRLALAGFTGTSSMRPRYSIACSFSPGLMPSASRMTRGITIWNLDETVMVVIHFTYRYVHCKTIPRGAQTRPRGRPHRGTVPSRPTALRSCRAGLRSG